MNMPIKSKAQNRLMQAAAASPKVAKKTGIPKKVAAEFVKATPAKSISKLTEKKSV